MGAEQCQVLAGCFPKLGAKRGSLWTGGEFTEEWELVERLHHPVTGEHLAEVLALPLLLAGGAEREGVVFILLAGVGKRSDLGEDFQRSGAMSRLPLPRPPAVLCNNSTTCMAGIWGHPLHDVRRTLLANRGTWSPRLYFVLEADARATASSNKSAVRLSISCDRYPPCERDALFL